MWKTSGPEDRCSIQKRFQNLSHDPISFAGKLDGPVGASPAPPI
jgi:hypothetical protein